MSRQKHPVTVADGDWWADKGCATCGKPLKIVSLWRIGKHFWAHRD